MNYPSKVLERAVADMSNLSGVRKRIALRLGLHMLHRPASQTENLADALQHLVQDIEYCEKCHTISDAPICQICANPLRDTSLICVVEDVRDVMAIENTGQYKGRSEEHTSELQSRENLVCRLLLEKKNFCYKT